MGYFANGTEGYIYEEKYCYNCVNYTTRPGEGGDGCPILDMHALDNYSLCNDEDSYLDKLIPRTRTGNKQCVMFLSESQGGKL